MKEEERDWLAEARDLKAHPESLTTAKDATAIAVGLLSVIPDLEIAAYARGVIFAQQCAEVENERGTTTFGITK